MPRLLCRSVCSNKADGYSMHLAWGALHLSGSSYCIILIGIGIILHASRFSLESTQTLVTCATSPPWGALVELFWEEWLLSSRSLRPSLVPTGDLGESVLLPLRVPVPRFHHPGSVLFTNQYRHGVLPAVCRGEGSKPVGGGGVGLQRVDISCEYLGLPWFPCPNRFPLLLGLMVPTSLMAVICQHPSTPGGNSPVGRCRLLTCLPCRKPALPLGDYYAGHHYWLNDPQPWEAFAQAKLFVTVFFQLFFEKLMIYKQ